MAIVARLSLKSDAFFRVARGGASLEMAELGAAMRPGVTDNRNGRFGPFSGVSISH
jgi:hypothetical protein